MRSYSAERVIQDMLLYREKWGIDHFLFYDDHCLADKKRAAAILEAMIENQIALEVTNLSFFSIDENIIKLLRRVGIANIFISMENGNEDTLKNIIHKPGNLEMARKTIQHLKNEGIIVISNILVGLPGETKEAIDKGIENLLNLGCNWYSIFVATPLPGSEMFNICKDKGYLLDDVDIYRMDFKKCVIRTPDFSPEYIERKVYEINLNVNFVNNYDIRTGNYQTALALFERVINLVIDTHAFAYYYAAVCAGHLGLVEKYDIYKSKYEEMTAKYAFWQEWADYFALEPLA
jgi:radical SAM superfamily enzyme YgiQ (UPF0313 family)